MPKVLRQVRYACAQIGALTLSVQSIVIIRTIHFCYNEKMFDAFRHFLLVAEHGTFTEAAKAAHLSQPALSASIHKLEAELGAPLFVRNPRGAELSEAGRMLEPKAKEALAAVEAGKRSVAELLGLETGTVRIIAGATVCTYYLPEFISTFRQRYPKIQIVLREATTSEALPAIDSGEFDLAIVCGDAGEPWQEDELVLVTSPRSAFAKRGANIDVAPFITFPKGSTTQALLLRTFPNAHVVMELSGPAAIIGNLRAGIGVALVSKRAVERDLKSRTLVLVKDRRTPIRRSISLVHRGTAKMPPAMRAFYTLLTSA